MKRNQFNKGVGSYTCRSCGRGTRPHGGDPSAIHARLCEECWELSGLENQLSDEGETDVGAVLWYAETLIKAGVKVETVFPELMEFVRAKSN